MVVYSFCSECFPSLLFALAETIIISTLSLVLQKIIPRVLISPVCPPVDAFIINVTKFTRKPSKSSNSYASIDPGHYTDTPTQVTNLEVNSGTCPGNC